MTGKDFYYVSNYTTEILFLPSDEEAVRIHEVDIENGLGGYLWEAVKQKEAVEEIVNDLVCDFQMTVEEATHTVKGFLRILKKYGYMRGIVV